MILKYKDIIPKIDESCFIAPQVVVIGDVEVGKNTNIWYNSVVRGDVNEIRIGENTNIQDGTVIHVATFGQGTYIGDRVTIGHLALIHACTIEDDAFIGMKACIMDGAKVEKGAYVAAGALVTPGKVVKSGQVWAGSPAKYMRDVNENDLKTMQWSWDHYVKLAQEHKVSIAKDTNL